MTLDEAVLLLRRDPRHANLIREAYLDADLHGAGERFRSSGEFEEVCRILGSRARGTVVDLGAGTGIAAYAFGQLGAQCVYAVEPDRSEIVGRGALQRLTAGLPVEVVDAYGEALPLPDQSVDVVYARQVLHHTADLPQVLRECARVLRRGGALLACREHVADGPAQLEAFLKAHPIHQLAGGENAYPLDDYLAAILEAGLALNAVFGPWDSVINAYPGVHTQAELEGYPALLLEARLGGPGKLAGTLEPVRQLIWAWLRRPTPGRLYTFWALKP